MPCVRAGLRPTWAAPADAQSPQARPAWCGPRRCPATARPEGSSATAAPCPVTPRRTLRGAAPVAAAALVPSLGLRRNQPDSDGKPDQASQVVDSETLHHLGPVGLDRFHTELQTPGDVPGRVAPPHEA